MLNNTSIKWDFQCYQCFSATDWYCYQCSMFHRDSSRHKACWSYYERFDKGARTSTSADNDFQQRRERISNLQFRITLFVKIAVNLIFFFLIVVSQAKHLKTSLLWHSSSTDVTCDTSWSWWPKKSNYVRKARAWQQICNTHLCQFIRSGLVLFGKLQNLNSQEMRVAPLAL